MWSILLQSIISLHVLRIFRDKISSLADIHTFFQTFSLGRNFCSKKIANQEALKDFKWILECSIKSGAELESKLLKLDAPLYQILMDHKKLSAKLKALILKSIMFSGLSTSLILFFNTYYFELNFMDILWMGEDRITNYLGFIPIFFILFILNKTPDLYPSSDLKFLELQKFLQEYFDIHRPMQTTGLNFCTSLKDASRYSGESVSKKLENAHLNLLHQKNIQNQQLLTKFDDFGILLELLLYTPSVLIILRIFYLILNENKP